MPLKNRNTKDKKTTNRKKTAGSKTPAKTRSRSPIDIDLGKSKEEMRREHKEQRQREQRRRRRIFYSVLTLIVIIVGIVLSLTVFFNISKIEVSGETRYTAEEIISASGIKIGDNLFLIKRDKIRSNIGSKLPFAGKVELKNSLPNKLKIVVTDTTVKCAVQCDEGFVLINGDGKVIAKIADLSGYDAATNPTPAEETQETTEAPAEAPTSIDGVIILNGVKVKSAVVGNTIEIEDTDSFELYQKIMDAFEENEIVGITAMDLSDNVAITMMYQNRILIKLGSVSNLEDKIALANNVLKSQDEISPYQEGTIDLTIDKKAYFTPHQEEVTTVPAEDVADVTAPANN